MKNIVLIAFVFVGTLSCMAQNYDEDRVALSMFIERMITSEPFEGCRIVEDYNNSYLLSVVMLEKAKYKNVMSMNRVAQVKSQRDTGVFFNGSTNYSEYVIRTPKCEEKDSLKMIETFEIIKESSIGYVKQMTLLTSFDLPDNIKAYVFYKKVVKNNLKE